MSASIAYLRVSTDEQANSGLGLDAQLDAIYRDEGYSGSNPKRPALMDAIDALSAGDVLVVAKRDRLARDTFFSAWIEKEAKRRGARILSAAGEGTENDDPASVLMRNIIDSFAQYERDLIAARTKAALEQKRRRGERTGGDVPFGYTLASDGVHLEAHQDEQRALEIITELHGRGWSLRKICGELERRGIKTKKGNSEWKPMVISRMLKRAA